MVSLEGAADQPNPPAGVKSHGGTVSGLHAKRRGTHVSCRAGLAVSFESQTEGEVAGKDWSCITLPV